MEFHILGPVALWVDGERQELGSVKERTLLAALALEAGRPIALDALVGRLWDGAPPDHARENAHTYVSRLRGRLRRAAGGPDAPRIATRAHTYVLEAEPDSVDWHRYQRLVAEAVRREDRTAVEALASADALWQGEALAGLPGQWAETARRMMSERHLAATLSRLGAELRLGRFAESVSEISALVAQYPGDETLLGHLMLAYYGSRRFTDAVRVHEQARRLLMEEYGARPGAALERIHLGILNRAPAADLVRAATTAPGPAVATAPQPDPAPARSPRNLPHQPPLIGRDTELRALTGSIDAARGGSVLALETVSGMAGVGKTAIAVHTAAELAGAYPAAQLYLDLRAHSLLQEPLSPDAALAVLLRLIGAPAEDIPVDVEGRADLWRTMLAERRAVIVLDDVLDADQVRLLLPSDTPSLVILTSRRHISGLPGARNILLDVLPGDDAVALFRRFAGEERTRDTVEVRRIVRLCGFLPLAIEVVANRFQARNAWTLATLRDRLLRSPERLAEMRDADHEVARAFDLSYRTLTRAQRRTFRQLSLHPGPDFTAETAAAALGLPLGTAERLLEDLLTYHLLREPVPERYQFHDLLRHYAFGLTKAEDDDHVRTRIVDRMISYYVQAVDAADRLAYPDRLRAISWPVTYRCELPSWADADAARRWLDTERENILAVEAFARRHGSPESAARLAFCVAGFLDAECHWQDAVEVLGHAVAHWSQDGPRPVLCRALLGLSNALASTGQYGEAADAARPALEIARTAGDRPAEAEALRAVGALQWHRGEHAAALECFQNSYDIYADLGSRGDQSRLANNIGVASLYLGENEKAIENFRRSRAHSIEIGQKKAAAVALNNLSDAFLRIGRIDLARHASEEAIHLLDASGNRYDRATARSSLADILIELGETEKALELCRSLLPVFLSLDDRKSYADVLVSMGEAHRKRGSFGEATTSFTDALQVARDIGAAHQTAQALRGIGRTELDEGQLDSARTHLEEAVMTATRIHDLDEVVEAQTVLAHILSSSGHMTKARKLLRQALAAARVQHHRAADVIARQLQDLDGVTDA
ncbi:AfsR/SARP family transcriptional regulator [Actinacidiphila sp. bgisy145]|uniref:AfsR/SARP family transcriptional regulator n=1 Tax=Actinacidiphila sp. bgisy145 TaxID=3413792 RepID=UPI003EBEDAB2